MALRERLGTGTALIVATAGLLGSDVYFEHGIGFLVFIGFFAVAGIFEFASLVGATAAERMVLGVGLVALLVVESAVAGLLPLGQSPLGTTPGASPAESFALFVVIPLMFLQFKNPTQANLHRVGVEALGFVVIAFGFALCVRLRAFDGGATWILFALLVVKSNDIGAYFTGRAIGKTPLIAVSPNKTWEGTIGGYLFGLAVAAIAVATELVDASYPAAVGIAAVAGVAGQLGDLSESFWKRAAGVKDSGKLLPGFGGVLDLIDSPLFGIPAVYLAVWVWSG